tara:strand:+ start:5480 stop:6253 length:774 start_codon:yes stop_codon:yes gene_type:complete
MSVVDKYKVVRKLGQGAFSNVFLGKDIRSENDVVIKTESVDNEIGLLKHEASMYIKLRNVPGMLLLKWYGVVEDMRCLVLPYAGISMDKIEDISFPDALSYLRQLINILSSIHLMGVLHRDIKPSNILITHEGNCKIVDFGLSCMYRQTYGNHIDEKSGCQPIGSPNYMSLNVHRGLNPSRRDDLESLCYTCVYMIKDELPWNNCKLEEIESLKENMSDFCPAVLAVIWEYSRKLKFSKTPDYCALCDLIDDELKLL